MTILYHLWASGARFASQLPHVRFVLLLHFVSAFVLYLTSVRFETKDSVILASVVDTNWWLPLIIVLLIVQFINVHID
jgi:hypothetical protein